MITQQDYIGQVLLDALADLHPVAQRAIDDYAALVAENARLREALSQIADTCETNPRNRPVAWDHFCGRIARAAIARKGEK